MIEVRIPKELDHYEAKFIGPFTLRQMVSIVCALPVSVFLYNVAREPLGTDVAGVLCFIPAVVAFLFGWCKPYGMKFELFVRSVFVTSVLAPSKRKYKTENYFKKLMSEDLEVDEDDFIIQGHKKNKKHRSSSANVSNYKPSRKAIF